MTDTTDIAAPACRCKPKPAEGQPHSPACRFQNGDLRRLRTRTVEHAAPAGTSITAETTPNGKSTNFDCPDCDTVGDATIADIGHAVAAPETGTVLIAAERQRQIDLEGWTPEHDDTHDTFELSEAAATYCEAARLAAAGPITPEVWRQLASDFPWQPNWCKPSDDPVRNLVKAGALIAAEIDRLQRAKSASMTVRDEDRDGQ